MRRQIVPWLLTAKNLHICMLNCNISLADLRVDTEKSDKSVPAVKVLRRKKEHSQVTLSWSLILFRIWLKYPTLSFYLRRCLRNSINVRTRVSTRFHLRRCLRNSINISTRVYFHSLKSLSCLWGSEINYRAIIIFHTSTSWNTIQGSAALFSICYECRISDSVPHMQDYNQKRGLPGSQHRHKCTVVYSTNQNVFP